MQAWREHISPIIENQQNIINVLVAGNIHHGIIQLQSDGTIAVNSNHLAPEQCSTYDEKTHFCTKADHVNLGKVCKYYLWFANCILYKGVNGRLPDMIVEEMDKGLSEEQLKKMGFEEVRKTPPPETEVKSDAHNKK